MIRLEDLEVLVCCGAGGVGKTTTAAALGVHAAAHGRRVVVLTVDPARRLTQALGLPGLGHEPRPVSGVGGAGGGSLDASVLDMRQTFDDVVRAHAPEGTAHRVLDNPVYQTLSTSFAGTQEYMAMERLGQLRDEAAATGRWDLIIVDTPPSRTALDFLDAPRRLGAFLDGRLARTLARPARMGGSVLEATLGRLVGRGLLADVRAFVSATDTVFVGFRDRAEATAGRLRQPGTAFLVVATPERDALREASYFVQRLHEDALPLGGVVVNRVVLGTGELSAGRAEAAAEQVSDPVVAALLRVHADRADTARRQQRLVRAFRSGRPGLASVQVAERPDVVDLPGLAGLAEDVLAPG
ncbi:ArsA family ATPase [Ornithinicoccus halotolerans]|uniref:ArsA family ATPase n=1 Tax=Ornithinicoccus halotolerans TaxID=1748220 RepID=UPI001E491766|nr:ArsA-related P-loop ATPase [Ornithinicoccus halotolerans]